MAGSESASSPLWWWWRSYTMGYASCRSCTEFSRMPGKCITGFSEIVPDPVVRFCGPQPNNIMFDELQITNIPVVHNGSTVAIKCGGTVLATYNIPPNVSGFVGIFQGVIDHNTCPTPEITISFKGLDFHITGCSDKVTYTNNGRFPEPIMLRCQSGGLWRQPDNKQCSNWRRRYCNSAGKHIHCIRMYSAAGYAYKFQQPGKTVL